MTHAARSRPSRTPRPASNRLGLPLARLDQAVEVRMDWAPVPLWFVEDDVAAERLVAEGIPRGRTWTTHELVRLLAIPGISPAGARRLARVKLELDGVLDDHLAALVEPIPGASTTEVVLERPRWLPGFAPTPEEET
jgi:hypothetical protein